MNTNTVRVYRLILYKEVGLETHSTKAYELINKNYACPNLDSNEVTGTQVCTPYAYAQL